jgi:hypothetical protein
MTVYLSQRRQQQLPRNGIIVALVVGSILLLLFSSNVFTIRVLVTAFTTTTSNMPSRSILPVLLHNSQYEEAIVSRQEYNRSIRSFDDKRQRRYTQSSVLGMNKRSSSTTEKDSDSNTSMSSSGSSSTIDVDGMQTAPYLFGFIFLLCIWNFTIPTEFRRARLCSEQQVIDYPQSNCKTISQYMSGIQDYYTNGGTLFQFDFSVDRENNIWITGPQEIVE